MSFLQDHSVATDETAIYPGAGQGSLGAITYVTLGLVGEASEALEKAEADGEDLPAELGDVLWYLSRAHRELGIPLVAAPASDAADDPLRASAALVIAAGRCAEIVKKALRDDNAQLTDTRRELLTTSLGRTLDAWFTACHAAGADPRAVAADNLAKLRGRKERGVLKGSGDHR